MMIAINKNQMWLTGYFIALLFLHMNAILKNEDPIADTQTEGILYDQKMEQEKDGVKSAATPKVIFYGGQGFLTKGSLAKYDKDIAVASTGKKKDAFNWSDWWENKSEDEKPAETDVAPDSLMPVESENLTDSTPQGIDPVIAEKEPPAKVSPSVANKEDLVISDDPALSENKQNTELGAELPQAEEPKEAGDSWW